MMNTEVLSVVQEKDPWIVEEDSPRNEKSWITLGDDDDSPPPVDKKGRRKSWHAMKFDRKRRKGVVDAAVQQPEARQKRPSWWNIFAGQQWPR